MCRPVEPPTGSVITCVDRSKYPCRPVEPPLTWEKVSRSNFERDSSYASAFMANDSFCKACSLSKIGSRPSYAKNTKELIPFLHRIQRDICRLIHSYCGLLRYFMVLVDAATYWSYVVLLSTHNAAYAKLLAHIISLRAHHSDHPIMSNMSWQC